jgi:hypothetical protein
MLSKSTMVNLRHATLIMSEAPVLCCDFTNYRHAAFSSLIAIQSTSVGAIAIGTS